MNMRRSKPNRRLRAEQLESRKMLSANGFGAGKPVDAGSTVETPVVVAPMGTQQQKGEKVGDCDRDRTRDQDRTNAKDQGCTEDCNQVAVALVATTADQTPIQSQTQTMESLQSRVEDPTCVEDPDCTQDRVQQQDRDRIHDKDQVKDQDHLRDRDRMRDRVFAQLGKS